MITDHTAENAPLDEFIDVAKLDLRLTDNNSKLLNAAMRFPGVNDDYISKAPDLGAFEFGGKNWQAGSTLKRPELKDEDKEK